MANSGIYEEDFMNESDHDSLYSNEDSPADGYFTQRPFPESEYVENSSVTAEAEAKAREAAESRASSSQAQPSSQTTSPTSATRSPVWGDADEHTPLLDAGPAPPDYAAATAHRRAGSESSDESVNQAQSPVRSYGSIGGSESNEARTQRQDDDRQWPFGNRGNPFQSPDFPFGPAGNPVNQPGFPFGQNSPFAHPPNSANHAGNRFFSTRGMQSMADRPPEYAHDDDESEDAGLWRQYRNRRERRSWRRWSGRFAPKSVLGWCAALTILGLLIFASQASLKPHSDTEKSPINGNVTGPIAPTLPDDRSRPPADDDFPIHRKLDHCPFTRFTKSYEFGFDDMANFTFMELMEAHTNLNLALSGTIYIASAPKEQEHDILVTVSYATTSLWRVTSPHFIMDREGLNLQFPNIEKEGAMDSRGASCMDISVAIQVKAGVELGDWFIGTGNLNVETVKLESDTRSSEYLQPMRVVNSSIETISGSIKGQYALRDLLLVKSQSGAINVSVDPKDEDADRPAPADFTARSTSGSVHVEFPTSGDIPEREYRTRVETQSSAIGGSYILGLMSSFTTVSGSITAKLLPYDATEPVSSLRTESRSGATIIEVLEPYRNASKPMSALHSYHRTSAGSGAITVKYPEQWTGTIDAETLTGSITLEGKDVKVDVDSHYSPMVRHVIAHKGHGDSRLDLRSSSGGMTIQVGDD